MKYLLIAFLLIGCTTESKIIKDTSTSRIKMKEFRVIQGAAFSIVEVDGVEFFVNNRGGIVRLIK